MKLQVTRLIPDSHGTKCNQEMEPIDNTMHSHILRIPFKTEKGILKQWVSRFDIYPFLERFSQASSSFVSSPWVCTIVLIFVNDISSCHRSSSGYQDATEKILKLLDCKPDLIIGNYTDGNIVASLMASRLGVTQVNFAI